MNKFNLIVQSICFIVQTFGLVVGVWTHNYILAAWCAGWEYYSLCKIVSEIQDHTEVR